MALARHIPASGHLRVQSQTSPRTTKGSRRPGWLRRANGFYCEQGVWFCKEYGNDDEVYFNSLARVFAQAGGLAAKLPDRIGKGLFDRLDKVREVSHQFGYGVGEEMDTIFARSIS